MKICFFGSGRCGLTILRKMMNIHPDLFVFNETHWIEKLYEKYGTLTSYPENFLRVVEHTYFMDGTLVTDFDRSKLFHLVKPDQEITIQEFADAVARTVSGEGKRYWADKTPDYICYLYQIHRLWPSCKFIHLIRNGYNVAISMSKHKGYRYLASANEISWVPLSYNKAYSNISLKDLPISSFSRLWYDRLSRARNDAKSLPSDSYLEIRYEDLMKDARSALQTICTFTGLDVDNQWLTAAGALFDSSRQIRHDPMVIRSQLGPKEIELMEELGYLDSRE